MQRHFKWEVSYCLVSVVNIHNNFFNVFDCFLYFVDYGIHNDHGFNFFDCFLYFIDDRIHNDHDFYVNAKV